MLMDLDVGGDAGAAHIAPRREHNAFAPIRPGALHVYGVDFLSNKEVLEIFEEYHPLSVEWLDDSSCNVLFDSSTTTPAEASSSGATVDAEDDAVARVLKELASGEFLDEPWILSKMISLGKEKQPPQQQQQQQRGKPRRAPRRDFRLEIRLSTEADRKEVGHSGHTDSVYYAAVKEQQALKKQEEEVRRNKKRQRRNRIPPAAGDAARMAPAAAPAPASLALGSGAAGCAAQDASVPHENAASSLDGRVAAVASDSATASAPRFGSRGLLDPLLFLRAAGSTAAPASADLATTEIAGQRKNEDLKAAMRRAEAEYASVLLPGCGAIANVNASQATSSGLERGRSQGQRTTDAAWGKRGRDSTPGRSSGCHERAVGRGQGTNTQASSASLRGRKRRPMEQEPRAVSSTAAPTRKVQTFPEIEAFLSAHHVRCQRFILHRTFRSIKFGLQKQGAPKAPFGGKPVKSPFVTSTTGVGEQNVAVVMQPAVGEGTPVADVTVPEAPNHFSAVLKPSQTVAAESIVAAKIGEVPKTADSALPPWEQYLKSNHAFVRNGHFMHTVAWEADGRRILTAIPHPTRVDLDRLAKAIQVPRSAIKQRRLKDISTETGFPIFVCPPFGHPKDSQGRDPLLLVDSMITEFKKPLLFDCGSVGLSVPVSEFFKSTRAACIEGLGKVEASAPVTAKMAVETLDVAAAPPDSPDASPEPAPEPRPAGTPRGPEVNNAEAMEA